MAWRVWGGDAHRPGVSVALKEAWRDLRDARLIARHLLYRDLAAKYRESYLGYAWAFLPAIVLAASVTVAGRAGILNTTASGIPYPALVFIGTCLWQTFAEAVLGPVQAMVQARPILVRIRFPHEAVLLAKLGEVALNSALRAMLIAVALFVWDVAPQGYLPLAGMGVLSLILLGTAIGVLLAPMGGLYNDVAQGLTIGLGFWMFLTPVIYERAAPGSLVERLNLVNPVTPLLVTTRECMAGVAPTQLAAFASVSLASACLLVAAWLFYRFAMPYVIERAG